MHFKTQKYHKKLFKNDKTDEFYYITIKIYQYYYKKF